MRWVGHHRLTFAAAIAPSFLTGCSGDGSSADPASPQPASGFAVLDAPARDDTVQVQLVPVWPAVSLELRDAGGRPRRDALVTWTVRRGSASGKAVFNFTPPFIRHDSTESRTDAQGRTAVRIGFVATGTDTLVARDETGAVVRLAFTRRPASAASIVFLPGDTAVVRGRTTRLRLTVLDRFGFVRPDTVTQLTAAGPLTVDPSGVITGIDYGVGTVTATLGSLTGTARVTVVPPGRLLFDTGEATAYVIRTDGSDAQLLGSLGAPDTWTPTPDRTGVIRSGNPLVGHRSGPFRMTVLSAAPGNAVASFREHVREIPVPFAGGDWVGSQLEPFWSADRTWIYFTMNPATEILTSSHAEGPRLEIWRVHPDGTGAAVVVPQGVLPDGTGAGWHSPSVSPDGTRLAYLDARGSLYVRDLATGATRLLGAFAAREARWSPTTDRIATWGARGMLVTTADGARTQVLAPNNAGQWGVGDWSPDGAWLVFRSGYGTDLVELETGRTARLTFGPLLSAFRPVWLSPDGE
jgi:hypothetical protein